MTTASSSGTSPRGLDRSSDRGVSASARLAPRRTSVSRPAISAARKASEATNPRVTPTATSRASSTTQRTAPASGTCPARRGRHSTASARPSPTRMGAGTWGPPKAGTSQVTGTVRAAPRPTATSARSSAGPLDIAPHQPAQEELPAVGEHEEQELERQRHGGGRQHVHPQGQEQVGDHHVDDQEGEKEEEPDLEGAPELRGEERRHRHQQVAIG